MKPALFGPLVFCFVLTLPGCAGNNDSTEVGDDTELLENHPSTMLNQFALEDCSEYGCPNGCVRVDYGIDEDGSGELDVSEVDGSEYICHGADGSNGTQGAAGQNGEDGSNCTVSEEDCLATLACEDGTSVSWLLTGCLQWMPCPLGMDFDAASNTCSGDYDLLQYCTVADNSCNGGTNDGVLDSGPVFESCEALIHTGQSDWRVPTVEEFQALMDSGRVFPDQFPTDEWIFSASSNPDIAPMDAYIAKFSDWNGGIKVTEISSNGKAATHAVLCVRVN